MDMISFLASEPFDRSGDTPLYVQLKHRIALLIASQAFDTKTPLPRELEICERLELSRATVRRCFQDLVIEGRVVRKRGQGTFIKPQTSAPGIDLALNFSARMREADGFRARRFSPFQAYRPSAASPPGSKCPKGHPSGRFAAYVSPTTNPWSSTTSISPCHFAPSSHAKTWMARSTPTSRKRPASCPQASMPSTRRSTSTSMRRAFGTEHR